MTKEYRIITTCIAKYFQILFQSLSQVFDILPIKLRAPVPEVLMSRAVPLNFSGRYCQGVYFSGKCYTQLLPVFTSVNLLLQLSCAICLSSFCAHSILAHLLPSTSPHLSLCPPCLPAQHFSSNALLSMGCSQAMIECREENQGRPLT